MAEEEGMSSTDPSTNHHSSSQNLKGDRTTAKPTQTPKYVEPIHEGLGPMVEIPDENVDVVEFNQLSRTQVGKYISMLMTVNGKMCDSRLCDPKSRCGVCARKNKDCWRLWGDNNNNIMPGWKEKDRNIYVSCGECLRSGHPGSCSFWKPEKALRTTRDDIPDLVHPDDEPESTETQYPNTETTEAEDIDTEITHRKRTSVSFLTSQ